MTKSILFLGATGGSALSALRRCLEAGYTCIAVCRTPEKLTAKLPSKTYPNLQIVQGNAHDPTVIQRSLVSPSDDTALVDIVFSSIGAAMAGFGMDDPNVCDKGMDVLLSSIADLREQKNQASLPLVVAVSSSGVSRFARDIPLLMVPIYRTIIYTPHLDKKAMEKRVYAYDGPWTVLRPSMLTNGPETDAPIRVGVEDPVGGIEAKAIGYTISREDVGKWAFEQILSKEDAYVGKAVTITY